MTTNKEFLYSLEPHELTAWFESEREDDVLSRTNLRKENLRLAQELGECMAICDALKSENDNWRKLCGKLIDKAHEMQLIADIHA